jgi:hypothetical protein
MLFFIFHWAHITQCGIHYGPHNKITIEEVQKKADFKVLFPEQVPQEWLLEIKTYPVEETEKFNSFRLHFLDKNDKYLIAGISQKKAVSTNLKENRQLPSDRGEVVHINNYEGRFEAWARSKNDKEIPGGILRWIQNGTYLTMESTTLHKDEMIKLAKSMKEYIH